MPQCIGYIWQPWQKPKLGNYIYYKTLTDTDVRKIIIRLKNFQLFTSTSLYINVISRCIFDIPKVLLTLPLNMELYKYQKACLIGLILRLIHTRFQQDISIVSKWSILTRTDAKSSKYFTSSQCQNSKLSQALSNTPPMPTHPLARPHGTPKFTQNLLRQFSDWVYQANRNGTYFYAKHQKTI